MSRRSGVRSPAHAPYEWLAEIYDRVYSWKDYAAEARRIHALVQRFGPSGARTLLDVACGTGAHLRHLSRWFDGTGIDESGDMLAHARAKLPGTRFLRGRMQNFRVRDRFDVITCLFSAIGYVRSPAELRRTICNFADHLAPRGVLLVEPWLTPAAWRPGTTSLLVVESRNSPIARMNSSETRRGRSVMDMHYLLAKRGRVRHWVDRHDMGLFPVRTMLVAFRAAGLTVRRVRSGFRPERGLYVAVKPGR
jgi:SAM-dependent methyltransferase